MGKCTEDANERGTSGFILDLVEIDIGRVKSERKGDEGDDDANPESD